MTSTFKQLIEENPTQPWERLAALAAQASKVDLEHGLVCCINANDAGLENVRHLLNMGTTPDVRLDDKNNVNLLMYVAAYLTPELLDLLLEFGADISTQNEKGNTVLHKAAHDNDEKTLSILLNHPNAKHVLNTQNNDGFNAIEVAMSREHQESMRILLEAGATSTKMTAYMEGRINRSPEKWAPLARLIADMETRKQKDYLDQDTAPIRRPSSAHRL